MGLLLSHTHVFVSTHMCIYMHPCVPLYTRVSTHPCVLHTRACMHPCVQLHTRIYMRPCVQLHKHVYLHASMCAATCMCVSGQNGISLSGCFSPPTPRVIATAAGAPWRGDGNLQNPVRKLNTWCYFKKKNNVFM